MSPAYTAPEVFSRISARNLSPPAEEDQKGDVYSFGVVIWECLSRAQAWLNVPHDEIQVQVRSGNRPSPLPQGNHADPYYSTVFLSFFSFFSFFFFLFSL